MGNTRPSGAQPESIAKIHEVAFYSLTSTAWDDQAMANESLAGYSEHAEPAYREPYSQPNTSAPSVVEHPCAPLAKILSTGTFYYALEPYWDLSSRLSVRLERDEASSRDLGTYDERFIWNEYIVRSLLNFRDRLDSDERADLDRCQFIVCLDVNYSSQFDLICLLCHFTGTRNSRLCWRFQFGLASTADERLSDHGHSVAHLTSWMETRWDTIQHKGC